jgi:hypothetical protein
MRKLHSVGMPELMGGEPTTHPRSRGVMAQLASAPVEDQRWPRVGPSSTQNAGPIGSSVRHSSHGAR